MTIYLAGSLAFDRIMTFPGQFEDHILPEKLNILNVCFLISNLEQKRGGTAGNIAYSLAMLGEKPLIVASVGTDFGDYECALREHDLPLDGIRRVPGTLTAGAYIMTDASGNQITGFHPAAMNTSSDYAFSHAGPADFALIGPTNVADMRRLPRVFRDKGVPYIFDPGQQIPTLTGPELLEAITGSAILISNDYELELIRESTGKTRGELAALTDCLITTCGGSGSVVRQGGDETHIGIARPARIVDPTGCGDAFRAGLLKGLAAGLPLCDCARLGAVCAAYCVEHIGPQEHAFTLADFTGRYRAAFGAMPQLGGFDAASQYHRG